MIQEQELYDFLQAHDIRYTVSEHSPVYTIEDMEKLGLSKNGCIAKNLFLRDAKGKRHFLVVMHPEKRVDLKELQQKIECSKLCFASEGRLEKYLGLSKGAVSPFGILNDTENAVEVIMDKDLPGAELLGIHPNHNQATVWIGKTDLETIITNHGNPLVHLCV